MDDETARSGPSASNLHRGKRTKETMMIMIGISRWAAIACAGLVIGLGAPLAAAGSGEGGDRP